MKKNNREAQQPLDMELENTGSTSVIKVITAKLQLME